MSCSWSEGVTGTLPYGTVLIVSLSHGAGLCQCVVSNGAGLCHYVMLNGAGLCHYVVLNGAGLDFLRLNSAPNLSVL